MSITADCHLHSSFSGDSDTPMETQILSGLAHGLTEMCFTEHYDPDFPYENTPDLPDGYFELDLDAYRTQFLKMKEKYAGRIDLYYGIEIGLQPHLAGQIHDYFLQNKDFDFVIGSTHVSAHMDPYYPVFFDGRTEEEAFRQYFIDEYNSWKGFYDADTCGHLDYVVRYGRHHDRDYSYNQYKEVIDPILRLLVENGIALEINTSALSKGCREFNPCMDIVRQYKCMGGEMFTIGADAHTPDMIAYAFDRAASLLEEAGIRYYTVFHERKPEMKKLA